MGSDEAAADAERKPDSRPAPAEPKPDGAAAAPAAPGGGLGERRVQAMAAPGNAALGAVDDPAERAADAAADQVMRMTEPGPSAPPPSPAPSPATPTGAPAPSGDRPVQRAGDPAAEQRVPSAAPATPARPPGEGPSGAVPDTTTPAGVPGPVAEAVGGGDTEPGQGPTTVPDDVQAYLDASRGLGAPLPGPVRASFETVFRRPLDDVRIHDDGAADAAARTIDALAFTRGTDIYFRAGTYDPAGLAGKRLLAHELAHVVQQRQGVNRSGDTTVRRAKADGTAPKGPQVVDKDKPLETIDVGAQKIALEKVLVPAFKKDFRPKTLRWRDSSEQRHGKQRSIWLADDDNHKAAAKAVEARIAELKLPPKGPYRLQGKTKSTNKSGYLFLGESKDIAATLVIPPWNAKGDWAEWEVDHKAEWQIGGEDDDVTNYWLLNPGINNASGKYVVDNIYAQLDKFLKNANKKLGTALTAKGVKAKGWTVTWNDVEGKGGKGPSAAQVFDRATTPESPAGLATATFMAGLVPFTGTDADISGTADRLAIYPRLGGGQVKHVPVKDGKGTYAGKKGRKIGKSTVKTVEWLNPGVKATGSGTKVGVVRGDVIEKGPSTKVLKGALEVPILSMPGVDWGGVLDKAAVMAERERLVELTVASPVAFDELDYDMDGGLSGRGRVPKPSLKLLEKADIAVVLEDGLVGIEARVSADQLTLPGPFAVTSGVLALRAMVGGELSVDGEVGFAIAKLATGSIKARAGTSSGFAVDAELDFDKKIFNDAQVKGSYADGKWKLAGHIGITDPKKVPGIKKADVHVEVGDNSVTATGTFETSLKGIDKGTVGFHYDKTTGMAITGEILLGKGIPGIKGGKLNATVTEGAAGWSLSGGVTAEPDVPGLTGAITGNYADGAFDVRANLGYERGQAKGTVDVGLTNRTLDGAGRPTGPVAADGSLTAYGGGTVTLTITPWLQGTVGLKLTPKGEIEVTGKVALPSTFEVFKEKTVEREVFSVGIDIPIVGVAVAGQRIGIFATIRGGMTVNAGFGPGQLRDVALEVEYNPSRPDDTSVTGSGTFVVPAHAGLRLQVDGGLGAGIPVVSATAGVSIHGELGLEGAASASAAINWTPRTGIVLDARGELFVEPKFRFGIDAFVDVSADLWVTTIELYHHTWKLAAFEYGSNLRFGLAFPLHYESGKPFELSSDQIQWTYPHIDAKDLLSGLMEQLVH